MKRVTSGDPSHGKALFVQKCGACHTLANAKTLGAVGPNLDDAFASDKEQGFNAVDHHATSFAGRSPIRTRSRAPAFPA